MTDLRPLPETPLNRMIGAKLISYDTEKEMAEVSYDVGADFLNLQGMIHGGIVATMLDQTCGIAIHYGTGAKIPPGNVTLELNISFMRPLMTGKIRSVGQVLRRARSVSFAEATLYNMDGDMMARASATFAVIKPKS